MSGGGSKRRSEGGAKGKSKIKNNWGKTQDRGFRGKGKRKGG
jgi:hypothetical protein